MAKKTNKQVTSRVLRGLEHSRDNYRRWALDAGRDVVKFASVDSSELPQALAKLRDFVNWHDTCARRVTAEKRALTRAAKKSKVKP